MEAAYSIKLNNKVYTVTKHFKVSVVDDYNTIMGSFDGQMLRGSNVKYLHDMKTSVCYNLLVDGDRGGFVYILPDKKVGYRECRAFWVINKKDRFISFTLFSWLALVLKVIRVYPHTEDISTVKSTATKLSLVRWHQGITNYLTIKFTSKNNEKVCRIVEKNKEWEKVGKYECSS